MPRGMLRAFCLTANRCVWRTDPRSSPPSALSSSETVQPVPGDTRHWVTVYRSRSSTSFFQMFQMAATYFLCHSKSPFILEQMERLTCLRASYKYSNSPFFPSCQGSLPFSLRCLLAPSFWQAVPRLSYRWSFAQSTSKPLSSVSCNMWKRSCILIGSFLKLTCPWKMWLFLRRLIHFRKSCYIIIVKLSGVYIYIYIYI